MVTRKQKLLAAGIVLAIGVGLSWPLRRTEPLVPASVARASAPAQPQVRTQPVDLDPHASPKSLAVASAMPSVDGRPSDKGRDPFADAPRPSSSGSAATPVFSTISNGAGAAASIAEVEPAEQIHVVHQGDSLDRLAKRYLGDEARALEIFDLNREVLENPHLLPIGAELRIPIQSP